MKSTKKAVIGGVFGLAIVIGASLGVASSSDSMADTMAHDEMTETMAHDEMAETIAHDEMTETMAHDEMAETMARTCELSPDQVNVKVKSPEGLGSLGGGEGVAASAVATLVRQG